MNDRQFARLAGTAVLLPGRSVSRVATQVAGVVFLVAVGVLLGIGVDLTVVYWFSPASVLGMLVILVAIVLRPRFGRVDNHAWVVDPVQAPTLHRVVGEVAAAIGAPTPHLVLLDAGFNASCRAVGPRQRRVLTLGLPLWGALSPQQRVALLGHELGHFANGDVRRGMLGSVPPRTLAALVNLLRPNRLHGYRGYGLAGLAEVATRLVLAAVCTFLRGVWILMVWLAGPDGQRAEYLADQLAARVAGSDAAVGLLDILLVADGIAGQIRASARRGCGPAQWCEAAQVVRRDLGERRTRLRQLSRRDDASLFATHPPDGLRARFIESRPQTAPAVLLSPEDAQRMDDELATRYDQVRRDLANS